ncbi:MAG: MATE family efflux transporter [Eubacterium sp.]|jgi:putative MATE family efflux protein|nr:MATE family efflux transporter [Eubacterium sp.]
MEDTPILKLLLKLSPPVMLALLIQSVYNIVDSYFVAKFSGDGLTALSIIYPIQLLMLALATGTGAGVNILISRMDGVGDIKSQNDVVKSGMFLGAVNFVVFALFGLLSIKGYYNISSNIEGVRREGIMYGQIILLFSFGMFLEANCTKMLQAKGNMVVPTIAQIVGAVINVILDPILIFGKFGFPQMGIRGAGIATVIGQWVTMAIVLVNVLKYYKFKGRIDLKSCVKIYKFGIPSIILQSLYTFYIVGLNLVLKLFTEDAVAVLGIYYKLQTFFFIPLTGLQQVIVPVVSYNYGAEKYKRVKQTLWYSVAIACSVMLVGIIMFMVFPRELISIFSQQENVLNIGSSALRIISTSFIPAGFVLMFIVYCQGVNRGGYSILLTVLRQVILFVPLAWLFHYKGLFYVWFTFPATEIITALMSFYLYFVRDKKK